MVHGKGKFYCKNGKIIEGTWQNNKMLEWIY